MLFGTSQSLSPTKYLDNFEYRYVMTWLCVYMDINLNWHTDVEIFLKKISSKIGILRRVKPFLTIDLSKTVFNSIVLPHFTHCDIIWARSDMTLTFLVFKNSKILVLELFLMRTDDCMYNLC